MADQVDAALNNVELGKPSLSDEFKKGLPTVTWDPGKVGIIDPIYDSGKTTAVVTDDGSACSASRTANTPWWSLFGLLLLSAMLLRRRRTMRTDR